MLWPFGFGLSYTTFEYSNLRVSSQELSGDDVLTVEVDVTNTGKTAGKEIVLEGEFTQRQQAILLCGGLLNYTKENS